MSMKKNTRLLQTLLGELKRREAECQHLLISGDYKKMAAASCSYIEASRAVLNYLGYKNTSPTHGCDD